MNKTLLQEAKETRENFITAVNQCTWDREARTAAEGLIIIYDQLVEMIEKTDTPTIIRFFPDAFIGHLPGMIILPLLKIAESLPETYRPLPSGQSRRNPHSGFLT